MNKPTFGLSTKTLDQLKKIFSNYAGIDKVLIYGSRAKGNYRENSGIDITLIAPNLTTSDLLKLMDRIEESPIPYKIDLSLLHLIDNPALLEHVQRVGVELPINI